MIIAQTDEHQIAIYICQNYSQSTHLVEDSEKQQLHI